MALNSFKKASIHVDGPGMYTTIQDAGRVGYQQYGMPVAGPMDSESYLLGQALVGNKAFRCFRMHRATAYTNGSRYMYCCFYRG